MVVVVVVDGAAVVVVVGAAVVVVAAAGATLVVVGQAVWALALLVLTTVSAGHGDGQYDDEGSPVTDGTSVGEEHDRGTGSDQ